MLLTILLEDADIVVIDKSSGLLSIPDRFDPDLPSASGLLTKQYGEIFIVHRLDRETSGVMVFAKNAVAHRALNIQFEEHSARKRYEAVVDGVIVADSGTIDLPLAPHPKRKGTMHVAGAEGKPAVTHYTVLERFKNFTHVALDLETGRQHQIRVHCAAIGHPLCVDAVYGARPALLLSSVKSKYKGPEDERPLMPRLSLHAESLTFVHPRSSQALTVRASLPRDLSALLKQLRKWNTK